MSLTSLADAPSLPKSTPGSPFQKPNAKSRPSSRKLNDQSAIDALFQDDDDIPGGKLHTEKRNVSPLKESSNSLRNFDRVKGKGVDAQKTYALLLSDLNLQKGEEHRGLAGSKQVGDFGSKTKDPNDVLSSFLSDSLSEQKVPGNKLLPKEPIHSIINRNGRGEENTLKMSTSSFPSIDDLKIIKESPKVGRGADFGSKVKDPNEVLASFLADGLAEKNVDMPGNMLRNERKSLSPLKDRSLSPLKDRSLSPLKDRSLPPLKERRNSKGEENLQEKHSTCFLSSPEMNVLTFEEQLKGSENDDSRPKVKDPNHILAGFLAESLADKTMDKLRAERSISPLKNTSIKGNSREEDKERKDENSFLASLDITSEKTKVRFGQGDDFRSDKITDENLCPVRKTSFLFQESPNCLAQLDNGFKLEKFKKSHELVQSTETRHHKSQSQDLNDVLDVFLSQRAPNCEDDKKDTSETITSKQSMQPSTGETSVHFQNSSFEEGDACTRTEEDNDLSSDEDDRLDVLQDILSMLPGDDADTPDMAGSFLANNVEDPGFGDYRPSCLSRPDSRQRRNLTSFFPSSDDMEDQGQGLLTNVSTIKETAFGTNQRKEDNLLHQSSKKDDIPPTLSNENIKHQNKSIYEEIPGVEHTSSHQSANNCSPDETFVSALKVNIVQQKEGILSSIEASARNNCSVSPLKGNLVQQNASFVSKASNKEKIVSSFDSFECSLSAKGNVVQQNANIELSSKNEKIPLLKEVDISTKSYPSAKFTCITKENLMQPSNKIFDGPTERGDDNCFKNNQTCTMPSLKPNIVSQDEGILTEHMSKKEWTFRSNDDKESTNVLLSTKFPPVNDNTFNKVPLDNSTSNMSTLARDTNLVVENQRLRNENMSLREEIMKIETEKLAMEKELLNKELHFEEHVVKHTSAEREEAQRIADELRTELTTVKQSLNLTEGKIDSIKKAHAQEIETLKNIHTLELEAKDQQLNAERTLVEEKKTAVEAFSQLLHKADEWSTKIEQLYQGMGCVKGNLSNERPEWVTDIERIVSDRESSLQALEKRSTEVCAQLEKVFAMLELARKDMDKLQLQDEQITKSTCDQQQTLQENQNDQTMNFGATSFVNVENPASQDEQTLIANFLEEQKKLDAEKASVLQIKERLSQVDAALRKELLGHATRMQAEAEDMARQKQELEQAKEIAAEIAAEVENSRRELEMYKVAFDKIIPEAIGSGMHEELLQKANMANKRFIFNQRRGLERTDPTRNWESYQHQYSDIRMNSIPDMHILNRIGRNPQQTVVVGVDGQDIYYIKAQENFLTEAEKALEDMMRSPLY